VRPSLNIELYAFDLTDLHFHTVPASFRKEAMNKVICYRIARIVVEGCDGRRSRKNDAGCTRTGSTSGRKRLVGSRSFSHGGGYHGANGIDHQVGFVEVNPMLAVSREDLVG